MGVEQLADHTERYTERDSKDLTRESRRVSLSAEMKNEEESQEKETTEIKTRLAERSVASLTTGHFSSRSHLPSSSFTFGPLDHRPHCW